MNATITEKSVREKMIDYVLETSWPEFRQLHSGVAEIDRPYEELPKPEQDKYRDAAILAVDLLLGAKVAGAIPEESFMNQCSALFHFTWLGRECYVVDEEKYTRYDKLSDASKQKYRLWLGNANTAGPIVVFTM